MLQVMLCGAHDASTITDSFTKVINNFGGDPWFYQSGKIHHINSKTSRWSQNSRVSVQKADICVFVILEKYGHITWNDELNEALNLGKPFAVFALEEAWRRYDVLLHEISDPDSIKSEDDRKMVNLIRMISSDYELTVNPFTYSTFESVLRRELSRLAEEGLHLLEKHTRRSMLMEALAGEAPLNTGEIDQLRDLAKDEYETDKLKRKTALRRLAQEEVRNEELVLEVCSSSEQGVQRLAFDLLGSLIPLPLNEDTLQELALIANKTDDIGVARRLVASIAKIDPTMIDVVLEAVRNQEEGVRRVAFENIDEKYQDVLNQWGSDRMQKFLQSCEATKPGKSQWTERLKKRREELGP